MRALPKTGYGMLHGLAKVRLSAVVNLVRLLLHADRLSVAEALLRWPIWDLWATVACRLQGPRWRLLLRR